MPERKRHIYMWAIVPPPPLAEAIDGIRIEFSERFQCYKALKPPVHLTLYAPFKAPDEAVAHHLDAFKSWLGFQPAFSLSLRNFSFFENARSPVVFIDVLPNALLRSLNAGLSPLTVETFGLEKGNARFHPHFTIGYRDIPPALFPAIKTVYGKRRFDATIDANSVCLFRHNGLKWELMHEFPLHPPSTEQATQMDIFPPMATP